MSLTDPNQDLEIHNQYNANGQRVREEHTKNNITKIKDFVFNGQQPLASFEQTSNTPVETFDNPELSVNSPLGLLGLIQNTDHQGILPDLLGSPTGIVDNNGSLTKYEDYDSFGERLNQSNANTDILYSWLGNKEFDKDTYDFNARTYDPSIGRFNGKDPVEGTLQLPLTQNHYAHGNNNPNSYPDPNGRLSPSFLVKATPVGRLAQAFQVGYKIGSPLGKWAASTYIKEDSNTKNGDIFQNMSNNPYGGGFNGNGGGAKTPTNNKKLPILIFDYNHVSDRNKNKGKRALTSIAIHVKEAQEKGHPTIVIKVKGGGSKIKDSKTNMNRNQACSHSNKNKIKAEYAQGIGGHYGTSCDEYPFASSSQGGKGSSLLGVPGELNNDHNREQGNEMADFFNKEKIMPGDAYIVIPKNVPSIRPKILP